MLIIYSFPYSIYGGVNIKEIWKDIKGYENYQVSNLGRVYSRYKDRVISSYTTKDGYKRIGLTRDGQQSKFLVHVLVAEAFLEKPGKEYQVNHKDLNKSNNSVDNLEWVTCKENANHAIKNQKSRLEYLRNKMSEIGKKHNHLGIEASKKPVAQIDLDTDEIIGVYESAREASRETGANYRNISQVCNGDKNTHMGYKWSFYN